MKELLFAFLVGGGLYFLYESGLFEQDQEEHESTKVITQEEVRVIKKQEKISIDGRESGHLSRPQDKRVDHTQVDSRFFERWSDLDEFPVINGKLLVPFEEKEGLAIIQGDIALGPVEKLKGSYLPYKNAEIPKVRIWDSHQIPYEINPQLKNFEEVVRAIQHINEVSSVQLVPREGQEDYLLFTQTQENCYSYLGKKGGKQDIFLSPECQKGQITHEILHALGLYHEHTRFDRDDFVTVYWNNIDKKYWPQFKKIPKEFSHDFAMAFDYKSLMLYPPTAFALNESFATMTQINGELFQPNREELSFSDIEKINFLYQ